MRSAWLLYSRTPASVSCPNVKSSSYSARRGLVCGAEGRTTSFWEVLEVRWYFGAPGVNPETEDRRFNPGAPKDARRVGRGRPFAPLEADGRRGERLAIVVVLVNGMISRLL